MLLQLEQCTCFISQVRNVTERSMHDVFVACVTDDPAKYVYDTESSHFTMHWIHMKWSCGHVRYKSHIQLYLLGFCSRPWCWNSRGGTLQPL